MSSTPFTIATFNVNSINLRLGQVLAWADERKPDVIGLQETKTMDSRFPINELREAGWHAAFHGQKSYNGVCLLAREKITDVATGMGDEADEDDDQARFITGTVAGIRIVNCYVPQGSEVGSDKFAYKLRWYERLLAWLERECSTDQPIALVGDFNVAPEDEDIYSPEFFEDEVGAHPDERDALDKIVDWGFTDTFRHFHPEAEKAFSFFDYRTRDSVKYKKGWRIDHIYVTPPLLQRACGAEIDMAPRHNEKASDHTPVLADFERE